MDLGQTARQIIDLLEPELAPEGFDLLDVRLFQGGGRIQVRIYVDVLESADSSGDSSREGSGINIKQVAQASRTANMLLEEADLFLGQYVVEVSSPGIRRPLRKPAHYAAVVGEKVEITMWGKSPSRRIKGILQSVTDQEIVVAIGETDISAEQDEPGETVTLALNKIYEATLDSEFDVQALINADRRQRKDDKRQKRQDKDVKRRGRPKAPKGQKNDSPTDGGADES